MAVDTSIYGLLDTSVPMKGQVADAVGSIQQGILTRAQYDKAKEMRETKEQRNKLLDDKVYTSKIARQRLSDEEEARSLLKGINESIVNLETGGRSAQIGGLQERKAEIESRQGDTMHTDAALDNAAQSEAAGEDEANYIEQEKKTLEEERNKLWSMYPNLMPESEKQKREVMKEVNKETRSSLNQNLPKFDEKVSGLQLNYDKISGLGEAIANDNRMAVAQGLIAMVKLGEPNSAVLEGEMKSALNLTDPLAAVIGVMKEAGVQGVFSNETIEKLTAKLDPLSPANVNGKDLMGVANTVADASLKTIESEYAQYQEQGKNLADYSKASIFTKERENRLKDLRGKLTDWQKANQGGDDVGGQQPPANAKKQINQKTKEVRWVLPDGTIWSPK